MSQKRGQAAFEFIMTYGWVLFVALVAIAALIYWGVWGGDFLPEVCIFGVGLQCINPVFQYSGTVGVLDFSVQNAMGKDLIDFYTVVDPENEYCGGWMGLISTSGLPVPDWNGSAPFIYGETRRPFGRLADGSIFGRPIACDCVEAAYDCGGDPPNINTCCDSWESKNYYQSSNGLCQGYTSNFDTCMQDVEMHKLKRFKGKIYIYYREKGSTILHQRIGEMNLPNTGQYTIHT